VTVFAKNRERLLAGEIARTLFAEVLAHARSRDPLSTEHFSVDGTDDLGVGQPQELQTQTVAQRFPCPPHLRPSDNSAWPRATQVRRRGLGSGIIRGWETNYASSGEKSKAMAERQSVTDRSLEELRAKYLAARQAFREGQKSFAALVAGYKDMPAALNTKLDHIAVAGPATVAISPPPAGPPWAQPATPPPKQIITGEEWPAIEGYIKALSELRRLQEKAERLYAALPELDRQLGSQYRSPLEP
jgi:hypothetical protein